MSGNSYNSQSQGFVVDLSAEGNFGAKKSNKKRSFAQEVFEWLDIIITSIITVVIIFTLVFRVATIDGPSMQNTLFSNDKVIITNLAYTPQVGDIVVVSRNADNSVESEDKSDVPIIKRVIAVGGQTVDIDFESGVVSVDGVELDEPYTKTPTNVKYDLEFPVYVPQGCIFVLGDNRNESLDSRSSYIGQDGMIDTRYVLGRAVFRIFPFDKLGRLN
ncbi:MAG: signal peptidase I [Clostridia bacterium]|nr:signal peptidase I [Clostridia bacterium]